MKRSFDLFFVSILLALFAAPMVLIAIAIRITSKGKSIYWSDRIGKDNIIFRMPKFRTMLNDSPAVATHLLKNPDSYLIPIGGFLRRTSLDEIPQLFSVLKGDMSLVGPRPALFNQDNLVALRKKKGIDKLVPGITGWAQINGRDDLSISEKVLLDEEYKDYQSFWFDLKILWKTLIKVIGRDNVVH